MKRAAGAGQAPAAPADEGEVKTAELVRKVLFVTLCAVAVYCAVVAVADFKAIGASLRRLPAERVLVALGLATASFVVRYARWEVYLRALGIRTSRLDSALIFTSGLGMSVTPGKAGELLKSLMLRQVSATPIARSVPIVAAERITDAMALLLLGSLGVLDLPFGAVVIALVVAAIAALAFVLGSRAAGQWAIRLACRVPFIAKHERRLTSAHESLLVLSAPARQLQAFGLGLLAWTLHGLCLLSIANIYPGVSLSVGQAMLTNAAPLLAGALAMLPGGLGLTEASIAGALMAFGHGAVTPAIAAAITLVVRVITLWWAVALGLAALGFWQLRAR
ncbi:MAG TPA: lysylphosphatidylglycerol synthase transmembrane domain-containing protein [Polyangiales bacterium]|nr:lysylphosphatidylglycerol synthase transmembrane domain-containing protein [Polyangiales bacterium]